MKTAIIFLSVILLLANCQPEDYELTFFDSKTNSMNGKLFNAAEIYSYDPFILKFPGCGECYF